MLCSAVALTPQNINRYSKPCQEIQFLTSKLQAATSSGVLSIASNQKQCNIPDLSEPYLDAENGVVDIAEGLIPVRPLLAL